MKFAVMAPEGGPASAQAGACPDPEVQTFAASVALPKNKPLVSPEIFVAAGPAGANPGESEKS